MGEKFKAFKARAKHSLRRVKAKLRHAALTSVPIWLSGGKLTKNGSVCNIQILERTLAISELPDPLDGLRITHLTDMHIGSLITPARLPGIVESTNALQGDVVAVTGDFVDLSLSVLDEVVAAMSQLTAPLGVYFVPGNHDYLDNGPRLIEAFRAAGLRMMMNESHSFLHRDHRIVIAGIDYPHKARDMEPFVRTALHKAPRHQLEDLRILLSHHPNAFDAAQQHHIDLTLAGHTHGGQVVFTNQRGKKGSIGLGSLAHRYPRGLYKRGGSYLYVNSGVGSWFPVRYKCPAEIACLTLRCEADEAAAV